MRRRLLSSIQRRQELGGDADFDRVGGFDEGLYESSYGQLRLDVVAHDLLEKIPELRSGGVSVLDAGGGSGQLAIRLAQLGNEVVLTDPSAEMLARARTAIDEAGQSHAVQLVQARLQDQHGILGRTFELVICHAVLNWVAEPQAALPRLVESLAPEGRLSLMFGNRNARIFGRILSGDFEAVLGDPDPDSMESPFVNRVRLRRFARLPSGWSELGWGSSGVPLSEIRVREWLSMSGLTVESKAGIRVFHDYLPETLRSDEHLDELLALEIALRDREPFASLGALIHLICARPSPG
jgi:S-adenosylmethionine-dependent methyltransferase